LIAHPQARRSPTRSCSAAPVMPFAHSLYNDEIIKKNSKDNVELLILNIIEYVKLYPREFLFINNKGEPYREKGLQYFLFEIVPDKNIGINALRSIDTSQFLPTLVKIK
jgi:hypothetical protein